MESVVTSLVAILGTLLGATTTYAFQIRTAKQARQSATEERLWQERLAAYSTFAGALTDFRKSQNADGTGNRKTPRALRTLLHEMSPTANAPTRRPLSSGCGWSQRTMNSMAWHRWH